MAKVYEFSDNVLCLGKVRQFPESNEEWKAKLNWFKDIKQYQEFHGIDGEPMEFEWMIFTGFTKLQILHEIQKCMETFGMSTRTIPGKDYLHVDVQRHHMVRSAKRTSMSHQFHP